MIPSPEQRTIIEYNDNLVVVANPGSGKTFTLAKKIEKIHSELPDYKGVIAISYTRKASAELMSRVYRQKKSSNSFFGTIDKFYISEIVLPFISRVFGRSENELKICSLRDTEITLESNQLDYNNIVGFIEENKPGILSLYNAGYILLELVSHLAFYILNNSISCQRYLKNRYSHIIIDEYQDCDSVQHDIFIFLTNLGLNGVAVGDDKQSIFGYSNKSADYLLKLVSLPNFKPFPLTKNRRSHSSIVNYSMTLLSRSRFELLEANENRMYLISVDGNEANIALWLNENIPLVMQKYKISNRNDVAILCKNKRTGSIIDNNLSLAHKYFDETPFEKDSNKTSRIFSDILLLIFDKSNTKLDFIESYIDTTRYKIKAERIMEQLIIIEKSVAINMLHNMREYFIDIAAIILNNNLDESSLITLTEILKSEDLLRLFKPAEINEVQVMTIHKSKGLEFDIVFHLDLYEFILPSKGFDENRNTTYFNYEQDLNLHFVAITRAKECCIMCYSNRRTNAQSQTKQGNPSEFLQIPRLNNMRKHFSEIFEDAE